MLSYIILVKNIYIFVNKFEVDILIMSNGVSQ